MRKFLAIIVLMLAMVSCRTTQTPVIIPSKDSVRVEVRERVVHITDTCYIEVPAQSEKNTTTDSVSHLETDFAESDARINPDGSLSHSLKNKPQKMAQEVDVPVRVKDSTVYRDREVPVPYEVERKLSWKEKIQMAVGHYAILGILVFIPIAVITLLFRLKSRK